MEFWTSEEGRSIMALLAGVAFLLQLDNFIEAVRAARKGGDSNSEEKPSPPSEPGGGSSGTTA